MPEAAGGFDGTPVDLLLVMQELGRGLVAEPYFATVFAAEFVKRAADRRRPRCSKASRPARRGWPPRSASARRVTTRSPWRRGRSGTATAIACPARRPRARTARRRTRSSSPRASAPGDDGLALFVVGAAAPGIVRRDARTLDGQRVARIAFDDVAVDADALLADGAAARELLDACLDYGVALLCAEAVGAMEALNAATLDYAKTRKQFGQPIARFQVLQHRMVDMFIHLEQARSMAYLAAVRATSNDAAERRRTVSAAKVRIGQAARFIGQQAVQIHGGMGVTNELPAAHLFKRLTMIEMTLGDTDHHLQRFVAASHDTAGEAPVEAEVDATPDALPRAA